MTHTRDRQNLITATDIAKLATRRLNAWEDLRQTKLTGVSSFQGNAFTEHGIEREPFIAAHVQAYFYLVPNSQIFVKRGTIHAATPDGVSESRNGEYKTTTTDWGFLEASELQKKKSAYYDQVQWAQYVRDVEETIFAWEPHESFSPLPIKTLLVPRDESRIEFLQEIADAFVDFMNGSRPSFLR